MNSKHMFALRLEQALQSEMERLAAITTGENQAVWQYAVSLIQQGILVLQSLTEKAGGVDYPENIIEQLSGSSAAWQQLTQNWKVERKPAVIWLQLAAVQSALDKSGQFYQQAAIHSPFPQEKQFWQEFAQARHIMRRRLEAIWRLESNTIWEELGFAPLVFGKE